MHGLVLWNLKGCVVSIFGLGFVFVFQSFFENLFLLSDLNIK